MNWISFCSFDAPASCYFALKRGKCVHGHVGPWYDLLNMRHTYTCTEDSPVLADMFSTLRRTKWWAVSVPLRLLTDESDSMVLAFSDCYASVSLLQLFFCPFVYGSLFLSPSSGSCNWPQQRMQTHFTFSYCISSYEIVLLVTFLKFEMQICKIVSISAPKG